jgi:hypothetical protein
MYNLRPGVQKIKRAKRALTLLAAIITAVAVAIPAPAFADDGFFIDLPSAPPAGQNDAASGGASDGQTGATDGGTADGTSGEDDGFIIDVPPVPGGATPGGDEQSNTGEQTADGTYSVNTALLHYTNPQQPSMGDLAIEHDKSLVLVKDGKAEIRLFFKSLETLGMTGYLQNLWRVTDIVKDGSIVTSFKKTPASVYSRYEGVTDAFNTAEGPWYPKELGMSVDIGEGTEDIIVRVFVPVMEAITAGAGEQFARLRVDWESLTLLSSETDNKAPIETPGDTETDNPNESKAEEANKGNTGIETPSSSGSVDPSKQGSYLVNISLWKEAENSLSMGNVAFEGESGLVKTSSSGSSVLQVGTHPVAVSGYTTGITAFQYDIGQGYKDATVKKSGSFTTNTKYDGVSHKITCLRVLELDLPNTTTNYITVRFKVPYTPMDAVAVDGEGWLNARLRIDWNSATDAGGMSQLEATPTPAEAITDEEAEATELSDKTTGIKLAAKAGVVPADATLSVKAITSGAAFTKAEAALKDVLAAETPKFKLYDISLVQSKAVIQPNGVITISVPIPTDYDKTKVALYRINDDGTATLIKGKVSGENFEIALSRLSLYALAESETIINEIETPLAESVFTDITGHWAYEAIMFAVEKGLFNGTSETTFSPNADMNRGMFVTVLGRMAGIDAKAYASAAFSDTAAGSYYTPYAAWASENGIVQGVGDGLFAPAQEVTRQEMAVMLCNYADFAKIELGNETQVTFADDARIASWAKDGVYALAFAGVLGGVGEGNFAPEKTATRAEAATVIMRFVQGYVE